MIFTNIILYYNINERQTNGPVGWWLEKKSVSVAQKKSIAFAQKKPCVLQKPGDCQEFVACERFIYYSKLQVLSQDYVRPSEKRGQGPQVCDATATSRNETLETHTRSRVCDATQGGVWHHTDHEVWYHGCDRRCYRIRGVPTNMINLVCFRV